MSNTSDVAAPQTAAATSPVSAGSRPTSCASSGTSGEVTVRDVYEELRENRRIAYTTVMSVLRNLAAKGLLEQDKSQAAYVYRPKVTDEEVARGILDALVDKIMGGRREPLIAYLQERPTE